MKSIGHNLFMILSICFTFAYFYLLNKSFFSLCKRIEPISINRINKY